MPSVKGRERREFGDGGRATLQTKVPQWLKDRYDANARRRGLSLSLYLERLSELDHLLTTGETDTLPVDQQLSA